MFDRGVAVLVCASVASPGWRGPGRRWPHAAGLPDPHALGGVGGRRQQRMGRQPEAQQVSEPFKMFDNMLRRASKQLVAPDHDV